MSLLLQNTALTLKVVVWSAISIPPAIILWALKKPAAIIKFLGQNIWDLGIFLINVLTPQLPKGSVVKEGKPGYKGIWPPFVAPDAQNDSRAPCPGLNALANHGILPHDGKNITMKMLQTAMCDAFNFSHSLAQNTTDALIGLYGRSTIDLSDLAAHNIIEHDASLLRHDAYFEPNQVLPARDLIQKFLASASGPASADHPKGYFTPADLSRFMSLRIAQSKRDNPVFSLSTTHKFFGASNCSLLYDTVAGDVASSTVILLEERLPDGFETSMRQRFGYTMIEFHLRSAEIALGLRTVKL